MNVQRICGTILSICISWGLLISKVHAEFVVTMTGAVEVGVLNGASINQSPFVFTAQISSTEDTRSMDPFIGLFALSQASIAFDGGRQYDFDTSNLYWGQDYRPPGSVPTENYFAVGILDIDEASRATNRFGLEEIPPTLAPIDPNVVQPLSHNSFTRTWVFGGLPDTNVAKFSNGSNALQISLLNLQGASFSVVPEPSCSGVLTFAALPLIWRRCRCSRLIDTGVSARRLSLLGLLFG